MTDSVNVEQRDREAAQSFADDNTLCGCDKCIPVYAAAFARHRIAERERCIAACEAERMSEPQCSADAAYDHAINHCIAAIREHKP